MTFVNRSGKGRFYLAGMEATMPEHPQAIASSDGADARRFSRNRGLISEAQQHILANTTVAIAGVGGDGGLLAERLVRTGIGHLILCDPEVFEPENLNRQFGAGWTTLGRNKAEVVAASLRLIHPQVDIRVYSDGVTAANVHEIVAAADLVVDEIEYTLPALSVLLHREARRQGKYVFMGANIGWTASVFCFHPEGDRFETHFEYDDLQQTINPLKYLKEGPAPFLPDLQRDILSGAAPVPSVAAAVSLAAAVLSSEIVLFRTGQKAPVVVPRFIAVDLFNLSIDTQ